MPERSLMAQIDDRDAGIVETGQGTLLATTFTSLAYEPGLKKGYGRRRAGQGNHETGPTGSVAGRSSKTDRRRAAKATGLLDAAI